MTEHDGDDPVRAHEGRLFRVDGPCPECGGELRPERYERGTLQRCPDGHGMFVTHRDMRAILLDTDAPRSDDERREAVMKSGTGDVVQARRAEGHRSCPACGSAMHKHTYAMRSGVVIDACNDHGLWLDQDELQRIEAWFEGDREAAAHHTGDLLATMSDLGAQLEDGGSGERRGIRRLGGLLGRRGSR